jgi:hypothetical protein
VEATRGLRGLGVRRAGGTPRPARERAPGDARHDGAPPSNASHLHAQVPGGDPDRDAARLEQPLEMIGDLAGEPFLKLRSARVVVEQAGRAADSHDATRGNVRDVGATEERREVVDAQRVEGEPAHRDHFARIARMLEGGEFGRLGRGEAREGLGIELGDPFRSANQLGLGRGIEPECPDELGDRTFRRGAIRSRRLVGQTPSPRNGNQTGPA